MDRELLSLLINEYECWVVGRHTAENPKWHFIEQDMGKVFEINKFPEQMDYIIHLAQSDGHNDFKNNRKEIFDVNIYGMMQLLDYGVKAKIKNIYLRLPVEYMASWGSLLWKMNRLLCQIL